MCTCIIIIHNHAYSIMHIICAMAKITIYGNGYQKLLSCMFNFQWQSVDHIDVQVS